MGLGWNISSNGAINRVVNDKPDDVNFYLPMLAYFTNETAVGYYYNHGYLSEASWSSLSRIEAAATDITPYNYNKEIFRSVSIVKDYSPDEFSFSVGDLSGSFYLNDQGQWKVRSKDKIEVNIGSSDFAENAIPSIPADGNIPAMNFPNSKYLYRITLKDTRGIKYVFGGNPNSLELQNPTVKFTTKFAKTWYITQIIFPSGQLINYTYEGSSSVQKSQPAYIHLNSGIIENVFPTVSPVYLSKIETDLHKIQFYRSGSSGQFPKLDSISVTGVADNIQRKKILFTYANTPMDRLKLISVAEKDLFNQTSNKYRLVYSSTKFASKSIDHWGYYNLRPKVITSFDAFYASQEADTANCRAELLMSVIYPTGGYTTYTWEPHSYSKEVAAIRSNSLIDYGVDKYAGGVRIKQVTNYDLNNQKLGAKSYVYTRIFNSSGLNGISSGILYAKPKYSSAKNPSDEFSYDSYTLFAQSPLLENNVGSHISYSQVTEVNLDGSYKTTDFSNFDNGINNEYMDEPAVADESSTSAPKDRMFISNSHERGVPLRERMYTNNSQLVNDKVIEYDRIDKSNEFVRSYILDLDQISAWNFSFVWTGSAIKIYTNAYVPKKETNISFDTNGLNPVTDVTEWRYDANNQIKEQSNTNSKGTGMLKSYKYAYDFPSIPVLTEMAARHMWSPVIQSIDYKIDGDSQVILKSQNTNYGFWNGNNQIYPESIEGKIGNAPSEVSQRYYAYDYKGNVLSESQEGGFKKSYLWGYNGSYPIAVGSNVSVNEVFHENFESSTGPNILQEGGGVYAHTGRKYYRGATYPLNWTIVGSKSYLYSYWYRINNEWKFSTPKPYTGNTLLNGGDAYDDLLIYPKGALISTYTYAPLVGMTSKIDAKGLTSYYEYDTFQHLKLVRDQNRNITKAYCYNYAGQPIDCNNDGTQKVWVRIESNNQVVTEITGSGNATRDVYICLYSNQACTVPLSLPYELKIDVTTNIITVLANTTPVTETESSNYTIPVNTKKYFIGNSIYDKWDYHFDASYNYFFNIHSYRSSVVSNSNYIAMPSVQ